MGNGGRKHGCSGGRAEGLRARKAPGEGIGRADPEDEQASVSR